MNVLTLGTFDCLHYGHIRLLERSASFGRLTVGVNSDRFVDLYKGRPARYDQAIRMETIKSLRFVDKVYLNDGPGHKLIRQVVPDVLAVGSDWHGDYLEQIDMSQGELDGLGICLMFIPRTKGVSTSGR